MRIQNNITAMNTHRQYTINNDNVAKAAEKLSSGYRINRAADDAAGLAISEKMRSQIRGLNMATKNSQDAISLVQTAEGALQETHSMLQRMNELAVQAATGTNQDFDKIQAAKEFEQLKREINDVAESTTFNNMKILDGSLSYKGYQRSAATSGVTSTRTENKSTPAAPAQPTTYTPTDLTEGRDAPVGGPITAVTGSISSSTAVFAADTAVSGTTPQEIKVTFKQDGQEKTLTFTSAAPSGAAGATDKPSVLFDATNNITAAEDSNWKIAVGTNGQATVTQVAGKDTGAITDIKFSLNGAAGVASTATPTAGVTAVPANGLEAEAKYQIPTGDLAAGATITIGDKTYELVENAGDGADGNVEITYTAGMDTKDLAGLIAAAGATDQPTGLTITADTAGNKLVVTAATPGAAGTDAVKNVVFKEAPTPPAGGGTAGATSGGTQKADGYKYTHTIEVDTAKMKDGDEFEITIGGTKFTATYSAATDVTEKDQSAAEKFSIKLVGGATDGGDAYWAAKGNALVVDTDVKDIKIELKNPTNKGGNDVPEPNAMRIQVGALEDEQLAISIDAMNTKGLGLDGFNLESQNEAGMAITAVRAAVNKVSDQRATLGAMQNRLDHKIANLKVSSENLSAAESRIRDVDMASEMTNFTKNNILSQAATAMLAQANALPQNVLSLLG